jgi:hypothetical protein
MDAFPRTTIGGLSLSRMVVGTNWFLGFSHQSAAKNEFLVNFQTSNKIADVLKVFLDAGVDAVLGPTHPSLIQGIKEAEQRTGQKLTVILTPAFNIEPGGLAEEEPEAVIAKCKQMGAAICMPHQMVTDSLLDRKTRTIRDIEKITSLIRQYEMIPALSTHLPETITFCDEHHYDIETYLQIYNAAGFMMPIEVEWEHSIIAAAHKPVMTIKPLAAGRITPMIGLCFAWNTLRPQDLVTVGTTTPDEAREVIELSLDYLNHRVPDTSLQFTRSKAIFEKMGKA